MFECLAALKVDMKSDYPDPKSSPDVKKVEDHYDYSNDEVFSLELERSERGLGLALVDIRVSERAVNRTKTWFKGASDCNVPARTGRNA